MVMIQFNDALLLQRCSDLCCSFYWLWWWLEVYHYFMILKILMYISVIVLYIALIKIWGIRFCAQVQFRWIQWFCHWIFWFMGFLIRLWLILLRKGLFWHLRHRFNLSNSTRLLLDRYQLLLHLYPFNLWRLIRRILRNYFTLFLFAVNLRIY